MRWRRRWRPTRPPVATAFAASVSPAPGTPAPKSLPAARTRRGCWATPAFAPASTVLQRMGLSFDALVYHTQLGELADLAGAFSDAVIILNHVGRPLGVGPYAGRRDEVFRRLAAGHRGGGGPSERGGQAGRVRQPDQRPRLAPTGCAAYLGAGGGNHPPLAGPLHRAVRAAAVYVREQLPGGQGVLLVHGVLERLQAGDRRLFGCRKRRPCTGGRRRGRIGCDYRLRPPPVRRRCLRRSVAACSLWIRPAAHPASAGTGGNCSLPGGQRGGCGRNTDAAFHHHRKAAAN